MPSYVLGIGDTLEINFSGQQSGTYTLTINKNGQVYLPEIGNVSAVELTFDEFEKKISDAFKSFYISVTPSVTLTELKFIQVSILGAVKNPGTYLVNPFTTASNLLSFACFVSIIIVLTLFSGSFSKTFLLLRVIY